MIANFSCKVLHMNFGDLRNGRKTGLGQLRALPSDWYQLTKFRVGRISAL
jgi:hypothetical protein